MRFRTKTILGVAIIEMVLLAILIGSTISILRDSNENEIRSRAQLGAKLIASAAKDAVISEDLATLHSLTEEALSSGQIDYLRIFDSQRRVLAENGPKELLKKPFKIDPDIQHVDDGVFDCAALVEVGGIRYGEVQLGVSIEPLQALLASSKRWAAGVAIVELLLVGFFSWLLGSYLTRQLSGFRAAIDMYALGNFAHRIPITSKDELADTATSLNEMARKLSENKVQLAKEEHLRIEAQADLEWALSSVEDRNEQLNTIFELSPDGYVSFDQAHKVKFVNSAFSRMTGLASIQILGLSESEFLLALSSLCGEIKEDSTFKSLSALVDKRFPTDVKHDDRVVIQILTPYKRSLEVRLRSAIAKSVSQIFYCRDITFESEVDQMKSEFLSTAAHELRTPMSSIYEFSELLLNCEFTEPERREYLEIIHKQSQFIDSIITDLLDLARIDARKGKDIVLSTLPLGDFISRTIASFNLPQGRVTPTWTIGKECYVNADGRRLTQAFFNVLSNAYKYSPNGGDVIISLQTKAIDGVDLVGIRVQDNGIGMTPEQLKRVFERFYRADSSGSIPGTGLGMSITKEIMDLHHGSIEVSSRIGVGTTVTLWLTLLN